MVRPSWWRPGGHPRRRPRALAVAGPTAPPRAPEDILCCAGGEGGEEGPPPAAERQAAWEAVLGLRPGELSPENVTREHDAYLRRLEYSVDEAFKYNSAGGKE